MPLWRAVSGGEGLGRMGLGGTGLRSDFNEFRRYDVNLLKRKVRRSHGMVCSRRKLMRKEWARVGSGSCFVEWIWIILGMFLWR